MERGRARKWQRKMEDDTKKKSDNRETQGMYSQERKGGKKMRKERIRVGEREAAVADITGGY